MRSVGTLLFGLLAVACGHDPSAPDDLSASNDLTTLYAKDLSTYDADVGPAGLIRQSGLLQAVSADQTLVAYLNDATVAHGITSGTLITGSLPLATSPTTVSSNAWSAAFGGSTLALSYLSGPTASADTGSTAVYGALGWWLPGMTSGIQLSSGYAPVHAVAANGAFAMYWDTAAPSTKGAGDLKIARSSDCSSTACAPVTLASALTGVVSITVSADSTHAVYVTNNTATSGTYNVFLVQIAGGTVKQVITAGSATSVSFSTDSALLAAVGPAGALAVFNATSGAVQAWGALPAASTTLQVSFADPATLLVRATPSGAASSTGYRTTATAVTALASPVVNMEVSRSGPSGTATFVIFNQAVTAGAGDMTAYALGVSAPTGIPLATPASTSSVAVSSDQTYARLLESYDATTQTGVLTLVSLTNGTTTTIEAGVPLATPTFTSKHTLFYIDGNGVLGSWTDGVGATYAGAVEDFRIRSAPNNLYFDVSTPGTSPYDYAAGLYTEVLE